MARESRAIHERIASAWAEAEARGMSKAEVARQLLGDAKRWKEWHRYMKPKGPKPKLRTAVLLAVILGQPPEAFTDDPLVAVATELDEVHELAVSLHVRLEALEARVAAGFEQSLGALAVLADDVAELARRLPPEAEPKTRRGRG